MAARILFAKRINNGQSDVWWEDEPESRITIATNNIVYSARTLCSTEESDDFHKAFAKGETAVPNVAAEKLSADFHL